MFTIEQIKAAHSKVKSGADFPGYIQELKKMGVTKYTHHVSDGRIDYIGKSGFELSGQPKYAEQYIAKDNSISKLKSSLLIHQQGGTDYPTFCKEAAEAGVDNWVVDLVDMKCKYVNQIDEIMLVEQIPG